MKIYEINLPKITPFCGRTPWDGNDEMDHAEGRGWAVLKGDELHGMIYFHEGDESGFVATKAKGKQGKKGK